MRRLVLAAAALLSLSVPVSADHIGIFADEQAYDCFYNEFVLPPEFNDVYVIHMFNPGAAGSKFMLVDQTGLFVAAVVTRPPFLQVGNYYTGVQVAYDGCLAGDVVIATLRYFWFGQEIDCARIWVAPHPDEDDNDPHVRAFDCSGNLRASGGGRLIISTGFCQVTECTDPHPTKESTWGAVKALYR